MSALDRQLWIDGAAKFCKHAWEEVCSEDGRTLYGEMCSRCSAVRALGRCDGCDRTHRRLTHSGASGRYCDDGCEAEAKLRAAKAARQESAAIGGGWKCEHIHTEGVFAEDRAPASRSMYGVRVPLAGRGPVMVMPANWGGSDIGYLAGRYPGSVGHIYSPGGERGPFSYLPYALDNGAFQSWEKKRPWDEAEWRRLLNWAAMSGQAPLWVLVPDVVADRAGTLDRWQQYAPLVRSYGYRPALAVQDGMTFLDVPDEDSMLFLGGSTAWKEEAIETWCRGYPGRVHVGRVNNWDRLVRCWRAGAVSVDGSGWYHRQQMGELLKFIRETWRPELAAVAA